MDTLQPTAKKPRKRSKSTSLKENSQATEPEVAADLNGENSDEKLKNEATPGMQQPKRDAEIIESSGKGRKRKASELKDDSITEAIKKQTEKNDKELAQEAESQPQQKVEETKENIEEKNENTEEKKEEVDENKEKEETDDLKDMKLPPKQTLGKGKRARIPNKRYSDILLSPKLNHSDGEKPPKRSLENGLTDGNSDSGENIESEGGSHSDLAIKSDSVSNTNSPTVTSVKSRASSPGTPAAKKLKLSIDLTNPNFLKPFKYGWKRELVYRATSDTSLKRNGDVYYYTPSGKKVRSMREVSENLKNKELSLEDFTFFKEPLGLDDPEKEIIREAKSKASTASVTKKSFTPKAKTPKTASAKVTPPVTTDSPSTTPESKKSKKSSRLEGFRIKLLTTRGQPKPSKPKEGGDANFDALPSTWSSPKKATGKWNSNLNDMDRKPCRPCSIRCQGVMGLVPTLQCRVCLCLYHNECVGLPPHQNIQGYVCKNCQLGQGMNSASAPTIAPPPLTPINSLKAGTSQSTVLPKLQRIPRAGDSPQPDANKSIASEGKLPRLTPRPGILNTTPKYIKLSEAQSSHSEGKGLVGGVTTWFPPSSTIQVGTNQLKPTEVGPVSSRRPQFVEFLGNKKFVIIPKHSILSVSPTIAATAGNQLEESVNIPDDTQTSDNAAHVESGPSAPDSASLGPGNSDAEPEHSVKIETESPVRMDVNAILPFSLDAQQLQHEETETADSSKENESATSKVKRSVKPMNVVATGKTEGNKYMDNYLQNLAYGYNTLLYVFQYLKVQDLLRAGCVCHMWRDIASHPVLWRTVRMKNSQVHSFEGLANTLEKHGTVHLDLRKMLLPSGGDEIWPSFSQAITKVDSLRKIELCRCPAAVVEQLPVSNPKLEVINAVTIKCETLSLAPFGSLKNLQELRLKSTAGLTLTPDLSALQELTQLKYLSLTSVKDLNKQNIEVIADLKNLESLELGECTDFPNKFGADILTKLTKLEKLRLEKGQGNCYTFEILEAVRNMSHLEQLELVNFDIKAGFDKALGACTNIKKLLIIPTYISQSATTNHMVLGGVLRLRSTLSHFVWGVTLELLRVTELFVDQCEEPEKKDRKEKKPTSTGDSIPVLKPVPLLTDNETEIMPAHEPPQVEILPLPNLQKLLLKSLPTTRVKILKIPFHATWRQSITDTVN